MTHRSTTFIIRSMVGLLVVAAAVGTLTLIPAFWLRWEAENAREQARVMADADITRIQQVLLNLFARFDRATGWMKAQDITGETITLIGRLLRAEPLAFPAAGLSVYNNRGVQVASSSVSPGLASGPPTWFRDQSLPPPGQIALLGCSSGGTEPPDWLLVRSIEAAQDKTVGLVASMLPDAALRSLVLPNGGSWGPAAMFLRNASGCELVMNKPAPVIWQPAPALLRVLMRSLPTDWMYNDPVVSTAKIGNLIVSAAVSPETLLALRGATLDERGAVVMAATSGLAVLLLLLGIAAIHRRPSVLPLDQLQFGPLQVRETMMAERETTRRELDEIVVERDRVLAAIGHDVRTPINSILGICALLMDGDLAEPQRKWLQRIRASCEVLLAMLNGMLEIAAARVDGSEIYLETIDVASLVEEVGDVLRPQAEDKGLELNIIVDESMLGVWRTDPTRLRQVMFNLCGNAIKYTQRGSIELAGSARPSDGGSVRLSLRVTDTGMGIAEDEREHIFGQFKRGRKEVSSGQEGLGLGLALCREIAFLLGGTLSMESTIGVGSSFSFEIPIQPADSGTGIGGPLAGRSALVVGLSEGVRRRVASHLEKMGMEVDTAGDGFLAVGLAERMAYRYGTLDLMVLDAALPGLSADGLLTRLKGLRSLEHLRTVLVANGRRAAAAEGQASAVVTHPVDARELEGVVAGLFGDRSILQEVYPRAPAIPVSRILIVEDNRINQALFLDQLTRAGFSAFAASNGLEAAEAVGRGGFDGVLMDVQMPEMDGIEATRRIRAAERTEHRIPIIGMTAHTGVVVRKACLEVGMDMVLHKPVDFASLPLRLREVIGAARVHGSVSSASERTLPSEASLDVDREYLQVLVAEVGMDRASVYVSAFLGETGPHVAQLGDHLANSRWQELYQLAHSLAGVGSTLGAVALSDGLLILEDAAKAENVEQAANALREVSATWESTRISLRTHFDDVCSERARASKPCTMDV